MPHSSHSHMHILQCAPINHMHIYTNTTHRIHQEHMTQIHCSIQHSDVWMFFFLVEILEFSVVCLSNKNPKSFVCRSTINENQIIRTSLKRRLLTIWWSSQAILVLALINSRPNLCCEKWMNKWSKVKAWTFANVYFPFSTRRFQTCVWWFCLHRTYVKMAIHIARSRTNAHSFLSSNLKLHENRTFIFYCFFVQ